MKKGKNSYFWASYSDLMTSLFFIMLVLFALTTIILKKQKDRIEDAMEQIEKDKIKAESDKNTTQQILDEITKIEESTRDIEGRFFEYDEAYEKFKLKVKCNFPQNKYSISDLPSNTYEELKEAGREIQSFLSSHKNYQYLLIVEGQASSDGSRMTWYNYELSYKRAISLAVFWQRDCGFDFGEKCELQIAGSGDGSYNHNSMRELDEPANQRFLIYIIPKNILSVNSN